MKTGKKWLKCLISVCAMIVLVAAVYLVGTGLMKRTDVFIGEYALSDDGGTMEIRAGVTGSMGYIRDVSVKQDGEKLYLTFYPAFGGLNSSLGAKSEFSLSVDEEITEIAVYRGAGRYETILRKDPESSQWERIDSHG